MLEYYGRSFSQTASQPTYNAHLALLYYHVNMLVPSSEQSWKRLSLHQMAQWDTQKYDSATRQALGMSSVTVTERQVLKQHVIMINDK